MSASWEEAWWRSAPGPTRWGIPFTCAAVSPCEEPGTNHSKKEREYRSALSADGDYGEAAVTLEDPTGFGLGRGIYVASRTQRNFHGVCATILNGKDAYLTLTRPMNADIMVSDGGFATIYPVISGYEIQDARVEHLRVDGNRENNPTKVDGCRTAGIYLYRGDHCVIQHCTVRGYMGDGISFQQSNDVQVDQCVVERCAGFGLHPGSGSQRPSVTHCRAIANDEDGFFFCWRVRGGIARGNWLEGNGGMGCPSDTRTATILFSRIPLLATRWVVYWRAETEPMAAHRITFEGNTVRDNAGWGFCRWATEGTIIRHNLIEDSGSGQQQTGIRIGQQAGEVALENNTVKATPEDGG